VYTPRRVEVDDHRPVGQEKRVQRLCAPEEDHRVKVAEELVPGVDPLEGAMRGCGEDGGEQEQSGRHGRGLCVRKS